MLVAIAQEASTLEAFLRVHLLPMSHVAEKLLKADLDSCPPSHRALSTVGTPSQACTL